MREVIVGKKYRHFKGKIMVDDDIIWIRDYDMFNSLVDKEKYPEVTQKYRFELVDKL